MPVAETYKGLTIRLGGDSSGLQQALKAISSSVATTESQLRKLKQALKLDPGNTEALTKSLDLMGNKAIETQRRVQTLKKQIDQLGSEKVQLLGGKQSADTVRQLADATEDASERAAEARRHYNQITTELAEFYKPINDAVNATKNLDVQAGTALAEVKRLGDEYRALTGKDFNAGSFISDSKDADQAIQQLRELGLITDDQVGKLTSLRESFRNAFNENQVAQAVSQLDQMGTSLIKAEAEAKNVTKRFSEMSRAAMMSKYGEGVEDQLKHIENAANSVEAELKQLDDALALDPNNVELTAAKIRDLQEASNIAQSRVETLNEKLRRLQSDGAEELANDMLDVRMEVEKTSQAYDEATAEVKRMEAALRDAEVKLKNLKSSGEGLDDGYEEAKQDVDRLTSALEELRAEQKRTETAFKNANMAQEFVETKNAVNKAEAELSGYNQKLRQMGKFTGVTAGSLTSLGMSLSTSVTPTLVAAGWGIVQSAQDIDAAYRDMRKTVNGTEEDFEALRQAAIDFSTTNVTSADQMLSIQAIGGELGVATEDLKEFAETVSNMDVATDLNAEDAATALGQLGNIMHMTGEDFGPFSDALVRLGNNGASTESQIIDIAKRIGSMASIVDMSTPDVLAWASSIASTGQNAEAAGTAISNTMSAIETAVAGGGDKLEAFADVARMSAEDFANAWNENPTVALKSFIEGLVAIEEAGGSADATLVDLKITAVRQKQAIMGLMQTIGGLGENLEMSRNAWAGVSDEWGEAGDAAREAERKAEGFSGAVSRLQNIAQATGAELGESLVPIIDGVADVLGELYDQFSKMDDGTKQAIVGIGAFVAALGPMILLGKGIGEFFGGIGDGLTKLATVSKAAKQVKSLDGAFSLLSVSAERLGNVLSGGLVAGGIAVAVGGIAALVAAYQDWQTKQENLTEATVGLRDVVQDTTTLDEYADGIDDIGSNSEFAAMSVDELAESTAKHVEVMRENNATAQAQIEELSRAQDIINQYAGQTDLTADAQGRLQWALELVNDQFGLSITQADVASGKYKDQDGNVRNLTDSINKLIEAKKNEARANAIQSNLTEAYEVQADAADTLTDAQKKYDDYIDWLADTQKKAGKIMSRDEVEQLAKDSNAKAYTDLQKAESQYHEASVSVSELEEEYGGVTRAASDAADEFDRLRSTMDSAKFDLFNSQLQQSGTNFTMLSDDLRSLGVDTEAFANLTSDQLKELAQSYDGTSASIVAKLDEFGVKMEETGRNAAFAAKDIQDRLSEMFGGRLSTKLSDLGYDLSDLSQKFADAGITSNMLRGEIVGDFDAILAMAGDDINKLIYLIQNYDQTPIADKNGNINVTGEEILLYANGQMYTWNGQYLKDQNGNIVIQGTPELRDANGEVYTWNSSGQLESKSGNILMDATQLWDTNDEIYEFDGLNLYKDGKVVVDDLELTDAYDNCVKLTGYDLTLNGAVNCTYDDVLDAIGYVDDLLSRNGRSATVTINTQYKSYETTYRRNVDLTGNGGGQSDRSRTAAQAATTAKSALAQPMTLAAPTLAPAVSLMSDEAASIARAVSSAPKAASYAASSLVGEAFGTYPGNRRSLNSAYGSLGEIVNNYYDVRLDGINTTPRIQRIMVELLDEMHTMGVM